MKTIFQLPGRGFRKNWFLPVGLMLSCLQVEGAIFEVISFQSSTNTLSTFVIPALIESDSEGSFFNFKLSLETSEVPAPDFFADSITLSLTGNNPEDVLMVATLDIFGLTAAPNNPGGVFLDQASVSYDLISPLVPPSHDSAQAFDIRVRIPAGLEGVLTTANFDFFDNQNGIASLAHAAFPQVPEPKMMSLLIISCLMISRKKRGLR